MKGETPKKEIPGYRFVIINKLPNGDTEHIYEKVATPTTNVITSWVDGNGNPLKSTEKGSRERGIIPGYEFVRKVVDKDGNVHYIFRKVATPKAQVKRLVNTGSEINNIAEAGFGALLAGITVAIRRRRKED